MAVRACCVDCSSDALALLIPERRNGAVRYFIGRCGRRELHLKKKSIEGAASVSSELHCRSFTFMANAGSASGPAKLKEALGINRGKKENEMGSGGCGARQVRTREDDPGSGVVVCCVHLRCGMQSTPSCIGARGCCGAWEGRRTACRRMPYCTPSLAELHASRWDYWTLPEGVCRERRPSDRVTGELLVARCHRMARDHHGP